jgi:hypothetical protein
MDIGDSLQIWRGAVNILNKQLRTPARNDSYTEIKPCFKGSHENDPSNYRPISLLTSFYKIFEKIIWYRLSQHIYDHNIIV